MYPKRSFIPSPECHVFTGRQVIVSGSDDHTIKLWDTTTGALSHTIPINDAVSDMSFSRRGPFIDSNVGSFNIQMWYNENYGSGLSQVDTVISVDGQWVTLHHEGILWLPPEYRPGRSTAHGEMDIIGDKFGLVSAMEFFFGGQSQLVP